MVDRVFVGKKLKKMFATVDANAISDMLNSDRNRLARMRLSQRYQAQTQTAAKTAALWNDSEVQKTIETLDPEQRYAYSQIGEALFDGVAARKDPNTVLFEAAAQIQTMIRDGLDPKSLTPEEAKTLVAAIGPDRARELYDLNLSLPTENGYPTGECVPGTAPANKGAKKRTKRAKKPPTGTGKGNC